MSYVFSLLARLISSHLSCLFHQSSVDSKDTYSILNPDSTNVHDEYVFPVESSMAVKHCCAVGNRYLVEAQMLVWASAFSSVGSGSDLPLPRSRWGRRDRTGSPGTGEHRNPILHYAAVTQGHSSCSTPAHPDKTSKPIRSASLGCPSHL